ncbi:phage baseplate assembly protein V [Thiofaba sp. EF100]|uniref:phage baseplate assembly protein V n=1 Tax=Thiofaba sp. EF100 TaxID=3121274 RepID=UPI003221A001
MMLPETFLESAVTLKFGFVAALDEALGLVRCRVPDMDDLETWWLPVLVAKTHRDQHWHLPDVGEHVALLLDARGEVGVVLGAIFSQRDTPPVSTVDKHHARFADGGMAEYDRASGKLTVVATGPVEVTAGGQVTVHAPSVTLDAPHVTCTGKLTVAQSIAVQGAGGGTSTVISGNVTVDGSIQASGSIMDAGGNSNHHTH